MKKSHSKSPSTNVLFIFGKSYIRESNIFDSRFYNERELDPASRSLPQSLSEKFVQNARNLLKTGRKNNKSSYNQGHTKFGNTATVNVIIPLSGKYEATRKFLDNFEKQAIDTGENISLTFVLNYLIGADNSETYRVETLFNQFQKTNPEWASRNFRVLRRRSTTFNRGISLDLGAGVPRPDRDSNPDENGHFDSPVGANTVSSNTFVLDDNSLLFLCDVDVLFTRIFLQNVQSNTVLSRTVYYPVIFSEYDRERTGYDEDVNKLPGWERNQNALPVSISESSGTWRSFGYGLVAMFRKDLVNVGSFDTSVKGWGMEDVDLFSRFVAKAGTGLSIVRVKDPELQHIYHGQKCSDDLFMQKEKYDMCERSRTALLSSSFNLYKRYKMNQQGGD